MKTSGYQIDTGHLFGRDLSTRPVLAAVQPARHLEPLGRGGASDQTDDRFVIPQGLSAPVGGDEGEESVFDLVPLAGPGWKVADRNLQSRLVGQLLQLPLPKTHTIAVAAASIGGDQQPGGSRIKSPASWRHQPRTEATAKLGVSWSVPTLTK